jgi:Transglycosylase
VPSAHPDPPSPRPGKQGRSRLLASGTIAASAIVAAWGAAFALGNSPPGRAFLRERAVLALQARVGPVEVGEAGLDLLLRARLAPVTVLGSRPGGPILRVDRLVVRPRLWPLLGGRIEPASVGLLGLRLRPDRDGPGLGPLDLSVALEPGGPDGAAFRFDGSASFPPALPTESPEPRPVALAAGGLVIRGSGRIAPGGVGGELDVEVRATGLMMAGPRIGPLPLGPLAAGASARFLWSGKTRRVLLERGSLTLGEGKDVALMLTGDLALQGDLPFAVEARVDRVDWEALVAALPPELGPPPGAPRVSGALSARASLSGSLSRREDWDIRVDLDLGDLRRAARRAGPTWLSSGFSWTPIDPGPGELPRRIAVGPGNPDFVPYAEIPQALVRAVTASEDASFFAHQGFDFREIANAVTDRSRVRGASTISQQLAKNLFLSPERTLGRKVREALGTIALEVSLPKERLMEIYLNIAEWGPGVYGVGEAARFWFGRDARTLTPRESAFLATVIPSPRRYHARLHRSGITPWWNARIDDVLAKMRVQNQLTDEALAAALAENLDPLGREHPAGKSDGDADEADLPEAPEDPVPSPPYLSR